MRCWASISSASGAEMLKNVASNVSTDGSHPPKRALMTDLPCLACSKSHLQFQMITFEGQVFHVHIYCLNIDAADLPKNSHSVLKDLWHEIAMHANPISRYFACTCCGVL